MDTLEVQRVNTVTRATDGCGPVCYDVSLLTDDDLYLFNEGTHCKLYLKLGAHLLKDPPGVYFAVWAPSFR